MRVYLVSGDHYAKSPRSPQKESISAAEDKTEQPGRAVEEGTETHQTPFKEGPLHIYEVGGNCYSPRAGLDPASDLVLKDAVTR